MQNTRKPENLAYAIGLCRIALVVEQVHQQIRKHPALAELFHVPGEWGDRRARLTYFWWVVLGGNQLRAVDLEVIPDRVRAGINPELLKEWLAVFRAAAFPILGQEFTRAWMEKAERIGRKLLLVEDEHLSKLAKAS